MCSRFDSERILEFSGDVTDKSQAAVLPRTQLEMRTSAGREWLCYLKKIIT